MFKRRSELRCEVQKFIIEIHVHAVCDPKPQIGPGSK